MDEKELVIRAKSGDKDAFSALYGLYKDRLYRYAFYRLQNESDAEDAVQDCVVSAFIQIGSLKKPQAFAAWVFRVLYCTVNAQIKRQALARNNSNIDDVAQQLPDDSAERTLQKTELQNALDMLKDDEKEIVLLSVVAGFSSKEIGKIVDMTSGAVRSKLSRSLKKMRDFLE
ncbi:MAG: RNA polymerase sigma factor [Eubacterium sp.]|nr:RNA polymerase sigma factor [Eubacterium sp.]